MMITIENHKEIDVLYFNHGKVNALDLELLSTFKKKLDELRNSSCKAIVVSGKGSCFSAGVDLNRFLTENTSYRLDFLDELSSCLKTMIHVLPHG